MKKSLKITLFIIAVILLGVIGFCAFKIIALSNRYKSDREAYDALRAAYTQKATEEEPANSHLSGNAHGEGYWTYYGDDIDDSPINVDFHSIQNEVNPEIVGWIKCEGTRIDYPVVHHTDNDFFLTHNAYGDYSAAGALFIDAANFSDFSDTNTVIHGHHMNDGSMFGSLGNWARQDYFDNHRIFYISTPNANYAVQMVAYCIVPEDSDAYRIDFSGTEDVRAWVEWILSESSVSSGYSYREGDRFVTLSTCMYNFTDARGILVGSIVPVR